VDTYPNVLITVFLIWSIAAITPGPNFFITVHTAVSKTRRLSVFTVLGIVTGTLLWSISGFFGIALIFRSMPMLYYFIKTVGGMYLVYLGVGLLFRKEENRMDRERPTHYSAAHCFELGLFTNLLNPKTAVFITSLFAATIPPDSPLTLGMLCITIICLISAAWYLLVATVFSSNTAKRAFIKNKRNIERFAGGIFILFGLKLFASK